MDEQRRDEARGDDARRRLWAAHCHRLAEMTYAIADWCEDPEMMSAYVALGARWIALAADGPHDGDAAAMSAELAD
jgi:hypothetical protein